MNNIYKQWTHFKENTKHPRTLEAANKIGVSEAEIIASRVGFDTVTLLPHWEPILSVMNKLGQVMALTRNENCIHERKGIYLDPMIAENNNVGLIISPDIDLRFMLDSWASVFAVTDEVSTNIRTSGKLNSIQFFDKFGNAVHKVYLTNESQHQEWDTFVTQFMAPEQISTLRLEEKTSPETIKNPDIDIQSFTNDWRGLTDTHQFDPLLKRYQITRTQAFEKIGSEFAEALPAQSLTEILERIAAEKLKIMVFVGNQGCVQIHTGLIENLKWSNGWFNVLDPLFNLHLKAENVAQLWLVRKPTSDGIVTSIEAYDKEGSLIIQLYGPRRTGIPEYKSWRNLAETCKKL